MQAYQTAWVNKQFPFPTFIYQLYAMKYVIFERNIKSMISTKFHEILETAYRASSLCLVGLRVQKT